MNALKASQIYFIQYYRKHQWRDFSWDGFEVGGISNWVIFLMKTAFDNPFLHPYTIVCLYPYQLSLWFQNPCLHEMKKQVMSVSPEAFCGLSFTISVPTSLLHQFGIMKFNRFWIAAIHPWIPVCKQVLVLPASWVWLLLFYQLLGVYLVLFTISSYYDFIAEFCMSLFGKVKVEEQQWNHLSK